MKLFINWFLVVGNGEALIYDCPYSTLCRQVVTDSEGRILKFDLGGGRTNVIASERTGQNVISIERIVMIPLENWSTDCVQDKSGACIVPRIPYPSLPDDSVIAD